MNILGLNVYHADASVCLVRDGQIVAAVAEERLGNRQKHFAGFPAQAIDWVLRSSGLSIKDVDYVALGHDPKANRGAKAAHVLRNPVRSIGTVATYLTRQRKIASVAEEIARSVGAPLEDCRFNLVEVEHHLAHLASSFYASGFEEAAGFSYDASGDFVSTMSAHCKGNSIEILDRVLLPDSLGYFYTAICQFIGFDRFGEEYKVMGLAAYGQPRYMDLMERMLQPTADGRFRMDQRYFAGLLQQSHEQLVDERGEIVIPSLYSPVLEEELGPPRVRGAEITQRDKDLAASCQKHFESVLLHCLRALHERVPVPDLVTAGGCALNGVANARILRDTPFRRMYTHCAAGDDGTAVGAALHVWHRILEGERIAPITHASFGPAHEECAIEEAVRGSGYAVQRLTPEAVLETVADELHRGRIVGWYQGRSEWGPRALGNRSILAHPGWPGMKDLLNSKIKRREAFRPFAPSILAERVPDYFEQDVHSPFMMHVVRIREEKRSELAAVTHEDSTGRLHSVTREQNPMYYDLISAFARRSGTPVVLNTSFNENEPIVDTPAQAVDCFVRTDMDVLCAGPFLLRKEGLS